MMTTDQLTPVDAEFVTESVKMRIKKFEQVAKQAEDLHLEKEAQSVAGKAAYARDNILPAFREQSVIPFAGTEELESAVANVLLDILRDGRERNLNDAELADLLGSAVLRYATQVARVSFNHGVHERESRLEVQLLQALRAMKAEQMANAVD